MRANKESYMTIKLDALELNDGQLQGVPKILVLSKMKSLRT